MSKPVVVLNSGGFDSTVLLHYVKEVEEDSLVYSLFFEYGQRSMEQERRCARKNSVDLDAQYIGVSLPKIYWTGSDFYNEGEFKVDKQYLEMRNLIFLSYALSFAESVGAEKVYLAVLKSHHGYPDTSPIFINAMNEVSKIIGVSIEAPFIESDKYNLVGLAYKYGITESDFHSCDKPTADGKPCGVCDDCEVVKEIMSQLELKHPRDVKFSPRGTHEQYETTYKEYPVNELRFTINNRCQFSCAHCYYGYETSHREDLSEKELTEFAIRLHKQFGFKSIHYCGKEPMIDSAIFDSIRTLRKVLPVDIEYSVVTNGLTVTNYYEQLVNERLLDKVFLSVDDIETVTDKEQKLRNTSRHILNAIDFLVTNKVPLQVFIDLHKGNYNYINEMLYQLVKLGVREFFVRAIMPIGNAEDLEPLSIAEIAEVYSKLKRLTNYYHTTVKDFKVLLTLGKDVIVRMQERDIDDMTKDEEDLIEMVAKSLEYNTDVVVPGMSIYPEEVCTQFLDTLTLTSDGYVLGCTSAVSCSDYWKHSAFDINTPDEDFKDRLIEARSKVLEYDGENCPFSCPKSIDI